MPKIVNLGLNHETAPIEVRELLAFTEKNKIKILKELRSAPFIKGAVIINTCNRSEIYLSTGKKTEAKKLASNIFQREAGQKVELASFLYSYEDSKAIIHLFKVAAGLNSMIKGEPQVLGQVRTAYERARNNDFCDTYLHEVFARALKVGKRARAETKICNKAASVGYAAVKLAEDILPQIKECSTLIIGAGEMGKVVLKNLLERGAASPTIANRSKDKSRALAEKYQGKALSLKELPQRIKEFDVIISSTSAPHPIIYKEKHEENLSLRTSPQLFIDLAVPRDIDPELKRLSTVNLYVVDDLEKIVLENLEKREEEAAAVEEIIATEYKDFKTWWEKRKAVPLIKALQNKAENIRQSELERAFNKLSARSDLSSEEQEIISDFSRRLMQQLLHNPLVNMKKIIAENGEQDRDRDEFELFSQLFDLSI